MEYSIFMEYDNISMIVYFAELLSLEKIFSKFLGKTRITAFSVLFRNYNCVSDNSA